MAAFLDVILRGLALSGQAVAIGGVLFALLVYRVQDGAGARRIWTLVAAAAAVVVAAQVAALLILAGELEAPGGSLLARLAATQYFRATLARMLAAVVIAVGALAVRRAPRVGTWWPLLLGILFLELVQWTHRRLDLVRILNRQNRVVRWGVYYASVFAIIVFGIMENTEFIYFQF